MDTQKDSSAKGTSQVASNQLRIEINDPKIFTAKAVLVICAYGFFLCVPVFISLLALSLRKLGLFSFVYPLLVIAATAFFLPFGFGNPYVNRLLRRNIPPTGSDALIVQVTLKPRIRSGIRALLEDADDIGWLRFDANSLVFTGDSIKFAIPLDQVNELKLRNVGLRGLFVYRAIVLKADGSTDVESIQIAERSSCLLPASRKITRDLFQRLSSLTPKHQKQLQQTKP
jgi:hypothetical protein